MFENIYFELTLSRKCDENMERIHILTSLKAIKFSKVHVQ